LDSTWPFISAVSWKHEQTLAASAAIAAVKQLNITLSQKANPPAANVTPPQIVQVWFEPDTVVSPVPASAAPSAIFTIHGTTTIQSNVVRWDRKDDDTNVSRTFANGGRVLIRVHCGHLFAADNRNFSAALDAVTQQPSPHVPGGIFESWFFVKQG